MESHSLMKLMQIQSVKYRFTTLTFFDYFLKKAKFTEPSEDYSTKGDSIEYKTPSISGRALGLDDGSWKETEACSSEEDALKWINTMFGVTE